MQSENHWAIPPGGPSLRLDRPAPVSIQSVNATENLNETYEGFRRSNCTGVRLMR